MKTIAILALSVACIVIGYHAGRDSKQGANDALRAGFKITDSDGFEVEAFDDGLETSYWTTEPKIVREASPEIQDAN